MEQGVPGRQPGRLSEGIDVKVLGSFWVAQAVTVRCIVPVVPVSPHRTDHRGPPTEPELN